MNAVVQQPRSTSRTRRLTVTAMMAAISTVVMFFEFTFPPFPPFSAPCEKNLAKRKIICNFPCLLPEIQVYCP